MKLLADNKDLDGKINVKPDHRFLGIDAAKQIYEICPDIKIIILSMHASDEHSYTFV